MLLEFLVFVAIMGLYLKWIYGSPWTRGPNVGTKGFVRRSIPLFLFLCSAATLTIAIIFIHNNTYFIVLFSLSAFFLILAPVVTYFQYRSKK